MVQDKRTSTKMSNSKFQIFQSPKDLHYYYRLKSAGNNETILSGEGYSSKSACLDGIISVKNNAPFDNRYERKDNFNSFTFNLKASNGEIIGRSESYTSIQARENGIKAVKLNAPMATLDFID